MRVHDRPALWLLLGVAVASLLTGPLALADSIPSPVRRWDWDNDNTVDAADRIVTIRRSGNDWNGTKEARASAAAAEWSTDTVWSPDWVGNNAATVPVYVDGRAPGDCGVTWAETNNAVAATCYFTGDNGTRMLDATMYFNTDNHPFEFGSDWYDELNPKYNFQGVMTHELGHVAGLTHENPCLSGAQRETMCTGGLLNSFYAKSLEADDVSSMNTVY